ncbi:hypothetical protein ABFS82_08G125600 [Erythranthe guttata]|uniref:probable LRR receptor-like serine/threonine-protein kinase At4g20940 n=1 Tax=Erythranthe guttata TaxID=4155 RepID=UPI00064DD29E|nr:PREDICTED: probable LRR receptor-like serine/threonine-protein kinase At4g20940 [Erythranthe guttata]|eukprot:XP_012830194.1 PREDICTED: probable LRR receptor-like serine/threonine-protein kinase At4g20940 [Erythranthe guttata]
MMMMIFRLCLVCLWFFGATGQLPSEETSILLEFKRGIKHDPTDFVLNSWKYESVNSNGCPKSWYGITCTSSNGNIEAIVLDNLGLSADVDLSIFSNLTMLVKLSISNNSISGKLPENLSGFNSLEYLDISDNGFFSSLPSDIFISSSVKHLNLSHNRITGSLLGYGDDFGGLKVLDLSYNQLTGELPGFNFVYDLEILNLGNNMFSGSVPNNLLKGGSLVLTELDLSCNNLSGTISAITSTTLQTLNLSSNILSGELPPLTGSCAVVDFSKNQFEGNLTKLLKWGNVEVLDLSENRLTGPVPEVTAQFLRLRYLNISHNSLIGSLPKVITSLPKLMILDLSFNSFVGPLLTNLLTSSTLQELHLKNNKLSGSIDFSPSFTTNLRVLDLSENELFGFLPNEFGFFTKLQVLDIGGNNFSGSLPVSISNITVLNSLDISRNHFTGPILENLSNTLQSFNASYNNLSGVVPQNLRKFPLSSFYPGNSQLQFPNPPRNSYKNPSENRSKNHFKTIIVLVIISVCVVVTVIILFLLAIFIHYKRKSREPSPNITELKDASCHSSTNTSSFISPQVDLATDEKSTTTITGLSPSKTSQLLWSPVSSGDSNTGLDASSPERLAGELNFLDDTISFTPEELSRAPAEVLGRSSHGTCYKATLDSGLVLTVKWLRDGVAKQRREFTKEAKKFANIRHPNVVGLRGYYWGPTQHEKLILSDYISPGNLTSFLYDRPGRKDPPLTWAQRLKIATDIARGLNYLHFDRAIPHGNLKANNVLLDGPDLNARVGDYCLHRLMTQSGTIEQILDAGVLGYRAPELAASRKPVPSFKSDVYAFGVILLELITGKCAGDVVSGEEGGVDLTEWVRLRVCEGRGILNCLDNVVAREMGNPAVEKGVKDVFGIGLRCVCCVSERPGIKTVYEDLSSV